MNIFRKMKSEKIVQPEPNYKSEKEYYVTWDFGVTEKVTEWSYASSKSLVTNSTGLICAWKIKYK